MVVALGLMLLWMVTEPVASVTPGESARMVVVPEETPVMGRLTLVEPAGMVTDVGTVAMAGLSELRVKVRPPAWAGAVMLRVVLVEVVRLR